MRSQDTAATEKVQGEVERLVYSGDETGYTVCRLRVASQHDLVTVVGSLPGIQPGERLELEGRWLNHPKYGLQFQVTSYASRVPATANGIKFSTRLGPELDEYVPDSDRPALF